MRTIKLIIISICAVVATTGCSKSKNSGGSVATAAVTYYLSNNVCYDAKTNTQVASTNCTNLAYYFSGSSCYANANRQVTDMKYCTSLVGNYYYLNNSCWDKTVNTYTTTTNCTTTTAPTTGRYQWRNNICIDTQTGYQAQSTTYCSTTGGGANTCSGRSRYLDVNQYTGQTISVDCDYYDCKGAYLWDTQTGNYVTCQ